MSNVVTKLTIQENNVETASESTNHLVESLKTLLGTEPHDESDIITKLGEIKAKCNVDLAHRCLIAKHGTVDILVESCKKYQTKTNLLINVLGTMIALTNGQPDIITEDHISLFCQLIRSQINDATRITSILKLLHNACIKHEGNRQACANNGLIELILTTLQQHKSVPELVKVGCAVLRALTSDDDIRVPYGKAHEHAKIIVNDHAGIKVLLALTRG